MQMCIAVACQLRLKLSLGFACEGCNDTTRRDMVEANFCKLDRAWRDAAFSQCRLGTIYKLFDPNHWPINLQSGGNKSTKYLSKCDW
jgi:hypothetical protein